MSCGLAHPICDMACRVLGGGPGQCTVRRFGDRGVDWFLSVQQVWELTRDQLGMCRYEGMEAEEAEQLRALEIQSIKGGLSTRGAERGFGRYTSFSDLHLIAEHIYGIYGAAKCSRHYGSNVKHAWSRFLPKA